MLGLALLAAPLGYVALTGYLLYKVQPFPITLLPNGSFDEEPEPGRRVFAAAA